MWEAITEYDKEKHYRQIREEGFEEGFKEGFKEGFREGFREGFKEGLKESSLEILVKLIKEGIISVADAAETADMTVDEFKEKSGYNA